MGLLALFLGILGGLGMIMGVLTAAEAVPLLSTGLTSMFWLVLSAVLLLGCIAAAISRTSYE